jgi:hypothetical protein
LEQNGKNKHQPIMNKDALLWKKNRLPAMLKLLGSIWEYGSTRVSKKFEIFFIC